MTSDERAALLAAAKKIIDVEDADVPRPAIFQPESGDVKLARYLWSRLDWSAITPDALRAVGFEEPGADSVFWRRGVIEWNSSTNKYPVCVNSLSARPQPRNMGEPGEYTPQWSVSPCRIEHVNYSNAGGGDVCHVAYTDHEGVTQMGRYDMFPGIPVILVGQTWWIERRGHQSIRVVKQVEEKKVKP